MNKKLTKEQKQKILEQAEIMSKLKKTQGWKIIENLVTHKRLMNIIKILRSNDFNEIRYLQGAINEQERLLAIPDDFIKTGKEVEKGGD